jgi:hypothetical protein
MKNTSIFILLFFSFFAACKKEVSELAPPTQTGSNTFGAKLDGQLWAPQGFGPIPANDILEARLIGANSVYINARNFASSPNEKEFEIYLTNVTGPGTYLFNTTVGHPSTAANYAYYVKRRNLTPENEWMTSSTHTGFVNITRFDTVAFVVSGTFEFNAMNIYGGAPPISVTEGRFDVKMQ